MEKSEIITLHLQGHSNRQIARRMDLARNTVNKYIKQYNALSEQLDKVDPSNDEQVHRLTEQIITKPAYDTKNRSNRKWNAAMDQALDQILKSEDKKDRILGNHKQSLTKRQIHKQLKALGFDIGYTTVCEKVNERKASRRTVFIDQTYPFGQRFEYDFGEVKLVVAGKVRTVYMAVMVAPASGYRFALLYLNQQKSVFLDSQIRFFEHVGGMFEEGVYDNMKNVVTRFVGFNEKQLNPDLLALGAYYGFAINVTNCFAGNEKGTVESAVKVIRREAFCNRYEFDSLDSAQTHLDNVLAALNADKPINQEQLYLKPLRPTFEAAQLRFGVRVDKLSCVTVENTAYSVPEALAGKRVDLKIYPKELIVVYKDKEVARHSRPVEDGGMSLDIFHYLDTFRRKPGALRNSTVLASDEKLKALFDAHYSDRPREFISIVGANKDKTIDEVYAALLSACGKEVPMVVQPQSVQNKIADTTRSQIERIGSLVKAVGYAS